MPTFRRVARAGIWTDFRAVQISIAIKKFESDSIMNLELRITITVGIGYCDYHLVTLVSVLIGYLL